MSPSAPQSSQHKNKSYNDPFEEFRRQRTNRSVEPPQPNPAPAPRAPTPGPVEEGSSVGAVSFTKRGSFGSPRKKREAPSPQPSPADSSKGHDPFEEFRRKKAESKGRATRALQQQQLEQEGLQEIGWVEGLGPADGPVDPKLPSGFVRGRYQKKQLDPRSIDRPAGFESTSLTPSDQPDAPRHTDPQPRGFRRF